MGLVSVTGEIVVDERSQFRLVFHNGNSLRHETGMVFPIVPPGFLFSILRLTASLRSRLGISESVSYRAATARERLPAPLPSARLGSSFTTSSSASARMKLSK